MLRVSALVLGMLALGVSSARAEAGGSYEHRLYGTESTILNRMHAMNRMEVQMGLLAQERGTDPAVRDYGAMLIRDHLAADAELKAVAHERNINLQGPNDQALPIQVRRSQTKQGHDFRALRELYGPAFDQEFLSQVVGDHQAAIYFMTADRQSAWAEPVRALIDKTIPVLQQHQQAASELAAQRTLNTASLQGTSPGPNASGAGVYPSADPDQR